MPLSHLSDTSSDDDDDDDDSSFDSDDEAAFSTWQKLMATSKGEKNTTTTTTTLASVANNNDAGSLVNNTQSQSTGDPITSTPKFVTTGTAAAQNAAATSAAAANATAKRTSLTPQELRVSFNSLLTDDSSIDALTQAVSEKATKIIKWNDIVESKRISRPMTTSFVGRMFYSDTDIAEFRQDAFMEECGLDATEFD